MDEEAHEMLARHGRRLWLLVALVVAFSVTTVVLLRTSPWDGAATEGETRAGRAADELRDVLWQVEEGRTPGSYVFSPDGTRVLGLSLNGTTAWLWDAASGRRIHTLRGDTGPVPGGGSAVFSPDGERVAIADGYDSGAIWDVTSGRALRGLGSAAPPIFSRDGKRIVTSGHEGWVGISDVLSGRDNHAVKAGLAEVPAADLSPDGKLLLTSSNGLGARMWDATSGRLLRILRPADSATFSPDGTRILTTSRAQARILDVPGLRTLHVLRRAACAGFSPGGGRVLTVGEDGTARIWATASGRLLHFLPTTADGCASFSPDGKHIVTQNKDGLQRVWNVASGRRLRLPPAHAIVFGPDGTRVVTLSDDGTARIWATASGRLLHVLPETAVRSASFSPDGTRVLTARQVWGDTTRIHPVTARIWDATTGRSLYDLRVS